MKKKITITVCDVCEDEAAETKAYRIAEPDSRLRTYDLCQKHARPLGKLLDEIRATK